MKSTELKLELKTLLITKPGEVLQKLQKIFKNNNSAFNAVILVSQNYQRILVDELKGIKDAFYNTQMNEINNRLLSLIDLIQEEEACAYSLERAHFQKILAVCKTPDRQIFMEQLFPSSRWKMVSFDVTGNHVPAEKLKTYELLVFDNSPFDTDQGQHTLLKYYLNTPGPCILYFGEYLKLLTEYPEKAYFANSVFSFHTRLQEMINYLQNVKTYQDNAQII